MKTLWKRGFLEIMAQILMSLIQNPLKKSKINNRCNLDSRASARYLSIMKTLGLIKLSNKDPSLYLITQKGIDFYYQYELLVGMIYSDFKKLQSKTKPRTNLVS